MCPTVVAEVGPQLHVRRAQGRVEAAGGPDALEDDGPLAVAREEQAPRLGVGGEGRARSCQDACAPALDLLLW